MTKPKIRHEARTHSKWGMSQAYRYSNCPGSVREAAKWPNVSSVFAKEGTAAHEVGELCLRNGWDTERFLGEEVIVGNDSFTVDEEFAEAVQVYVDFVRGVADDSDAVLYLEHSFDITQQILKRPAVDGDGVYGSNDASVYNKRTRKLTVVDYKHGKGVVVDVKDNEQLLGYALGALVELTAQRLLVDEVEIVIVQPRAAHADGGVRRQTLDVMDLFDYEPKLRAAILATLDPAAPLVAGPWCKFCPAAPECPALRDKAIKDARLDFEMIGPEGMPVAELSKLLDDGHLIENWIKTVRAYAHARAERGEEVPGYKLVQRRATRKWKLRDDPEVIVSQLRDEFGWLPDEVYNQKLKGPATLEKLLPKAARQKFNDDYVVKVSSGTTLAPVADVRGEVAPEGSAYTDFEKLDIF